MKIYLIIKKINEFEEMFDVISKTSDIIASTLKGNPRQAKRFLNSFLVHHQNVCLTASRLSKTHYYILNKYDTHKSAYFSRSSFYAGVL